MRKRYCIFTCACELLYLLYFNWQGCQPITNESHPGNLVDEVPCSRSAGGSDAAGNLYVSSDNSDEINTEADNVTVSEVAGEEVYANEVKATEKREKESNPNSNANANLNSASFT